MPYRICKQFAIESGHLLSRHPGRCKYPHGHTRTVEVVLEADTLDDNQMVCDFKVLKLALAAFIDRFDHALCVNTRDPQFAALKAAYGEHVIGFENEDPTTEVLARTLHDACVERLAAYAAEARANNNFPLRAAVRVVRVRVWETADTWAEFAR